ncbi:MAG: type II secretion system protein, partial [Planctomycetes bacterium]|nr:type II secretion system protein [Planctomycetota bacterium]
MKTKRRIDGNDVSNRCLAFTLVEVLVVVSIIPLLASLLLPSLGRAKDIAKQVVCMSNQRVVGIAIRYYAQDNQEFLPSVLHFVDDVLPYLDRSSLPSDVRDYTRKTLPQALFCPCDPDPFPRPFMDFFAKIEMTS